jgi:tol-pal system protein YbgF
MSVTRFTYALALVGTVLLLGGCCAKQADLDVVRRDQRSMRASLADTQLAITSLKSSVDELKARVADVKGSARAGGTGDLARRVAQLETRLAGVETHEAPATAPVVDTSGTQPSGPSAVPAAPAPPAVKQGTPAAAIAMRAEEAVLPNAPAEYRTAMELYRQGQWSAAAEKFRQFVQKSPRSELADNAQYWIGECYYNQSDYNRAIIELNEVLLKYPQGDRVPGALLALATAFADSGDPIDARLIIQKLLSDHPDSPEAKIGRQKLEDLSR